MSQRTAASLRFAQIRDQLASRLKDPQNKQTARDTLIANESNVKELYCAGERAQEEAAKRPELADTVSSEQGTESRSLEDAFFWRIIGYRPDDSRAKIFGVLLLLQIGPLTSFWTNFVSGLRLDRDEAPRTSDASLPLPSNAIANFCGADNAEAFDQAQHWYHPFDFSSTLEEIVHELREIVVSHAVKCEHLDGDDRREPNDVFWPDSVPSGIVQKHESLIKRLHVESFKAKHKPPDPSTPDRNRETYQQLLDVESKTAAFYRGVLSCSKVFAILTLMEVSHDSNIWCRFESDCLNSDRAPPLLRDDQIPLSYDIVEDLFENNYFGNFYEQQFAFCAPTLIEGEQVVWSHKDQYLRLPLRKKKLINGGGGSLGAVSYIEPEPLHFRSTKVVKCLVMKRAPLNYINANEWENLKRFFDQPLKHEAIMIPRASLVAADEQIYIFSDKADCNLDEYMEDDNRMAQGPQDFQDIIRHFSQIVGIAEALEYLHCRLVEERFRETVVMYHLDVKAGNILVTETKGKLLCQLTDFGISSMKPTPANEKSSRDSRLIRQQPTQLRLGSGNPNSPPEAKDKGLVDSKADVWAFGTLFARFVAWLSGGKQNLEKFERSRDKSHKNGVIQDQPFFESPPDAEEPRMKRGVRLFFEDLIQSTNPETHYRERLLFESSWWLLQEKLLVCDKAARADIGILPKIMKGILKSESLEDLKRIRQSGAQGAQGAQGHVQDDQAQLADNGEASDPLEPLSPHRTTSPILSHSREPHEADRDQPGTTNTWDADIGDRVVAPRISIETRHTAPEPHNTMRRRLSDDTNALPRLKPAVTDPPKSSPSRKRQFFSWMSKKSNKMPISSGSSIKRPSLPQHLVSAIEARDEPAFRHALETVSGAELDQLVGGCTPLEHAVQHENIDMANDLLDKGGKLIVVHETDGTLLHRAALGGMVEMLRWLLDQGVPINAEDNRGITALSSLCQEHPEHFYKTLEYMLKETTINIESTDDGGATPLVRVAKHGDATAVKMLLEKKANLTAQDDDGYTGLHRAVWAQDAATTAELLAHDKDHKLVSMWSSKNWTALHVCADLGSEEALKIAMVLLANGANINAKKDKDDDTPLDVATDEKTVVWPHTDMVQLLIDEGADVTEKIRKDPKRCEFPAIREALKEPAKKPSHQSDQR